MENSAYSNHKPVTIGFAGDVMIGRSVNDKISATDYSYPWGNVLPLFKSTDLNLINLEAPLTQHRTQQQKKMINLKADPNKIQTLIDARIDVVNLANDHILDFWEEGMLETIELLNKSGIKHVGAGVTINQAGQPVIMTLNDITIGILGFTDNEPYWIAQDKPGTNYVEVGDIDTISRAVASIRDRVDVLILSIHWGDKMVHKPIPDFVSFAHKIIDAGVDIIHGHGAHVFQGVEIYKNKLIMYDTGDLIDDFEAVPEYSNDRTFFFSCELNKTGVKKLKLTPLVIKDFQVNIAANGEYESTLSHMQQLSADFGTYINSNGEIMIN